jgi:hypothetical protein
LEQRFQSIVPDFFASGPLVREHMAEAIHLMADRKQREREREREKGLE